MFPSAQTCSPVLIGKVKIIASISALGILLVFVGVHTSLIVLRWREPQRVRPFRAPLHIGRVPILPPAGLTICLALITQFEAIVYGVTASAMAFGVGVWLLSRPAKGRHPRNNA